MLLDCAEVPAGTLKQLDAARVARLSPRPVAPSPGTHSRSCARPPAAARWSRARPEHATQPQPAADSRRCRDAQPRRGKTAVDHQSQALSRRREHRASSSTASHFGTPGILLRFVGGVITSMWFLLEPNVLDRQLPEAPEDRQTDPNASRLKLLRGHRVLVASAQLRSEVRDQNRSEPTGDRFHPGHDRIIEERALSDWSPERK
jgi:hypothetical protein